MSLHWLSKGLIRHVPSWLPLWSSNSPTNLPQWTGGAFTSNAVVPRESLRVTSGRSEMYPNHVSQLTICFLQTGKPSTYDAIGDSGKINKHFFCPRCGSSLYTELEVMPDVTCVKAGGLDDNQASLGNKVDVEFYTKDRVVYQKEIPGAKQEPVFGWGTESQKWLWSLSVPHTTALAIAVSVVLLSSAELNTDSFHHRQIGCATLVQHIG